MSGVNRDTCMARRLPSMVKVKVKDTIMVKVKGKDKVKVTAKVRV